MKTCYYILIMGVLFSQCKPDPKPIKSGFDAKPVLENFVTYSAMPVLSNLMTKADFLNQKCIELNSMPTQSKLYIAQLAWLDTRSEWEKSEAFLFGPIATLGLDPAIDSWPVNFVEIDSVLNGTAKLSENYMDSLSNTLRGFHATEYILFGRHHSRVATELTSRQLDYLVSLSSHLKRVTKQMYNEWHSAGNNYGQHVISAGSSNSLYKSKKEAMLEITNGIIGIIDEVANGKIDGPFAAQDSSLEESPFSLNSWTDFLNNVIGAQHVFQAYGATSVGSLQSFTGEYNKALEQQIIQGFDRCIQSINEFKEPFGNAIYTQPSSVSALIAQLNELKNKMESQLVPLIQQRITD